MSTDLDTRLRDSLGEHAAAVSPPPVDVDDLVRRGRHRRGLRSGAAALVTAVAVASAVVVSFSLTGPGDTVNGSPDDQQGGLPIARGGAAGPEPVAGPRALFVTRQKVYLDGASYDVKLPWDTGAHVGRLGVAYPQPGSNRPTLLRRDGTVVPLAGAKPKFGTTYDGWVAADGNGSLVAWAENDNRRAQIVVFDTRTMREVGRRPATCSKQGQLTFCARPYVVSDGMVFIDRGPTAEAWDPATGATTDLGSNLPSQAHNKVLTTFEDRGTVDTGAIGPEWEQAKAKGIEGLLSYDGGWLLDANGNPKAVNWRDPGQSITYRPPGDVDAAEFDTDGSVLVVTRAQGTYTGWDCRLEGPCKVVVGPSRQEIRLVAWDL